VIISLNNNSQHVDLHSHSPIRLHGVVLNEFSTGTTLHFTIINKEEADFVNII
jgi:hypothetical protein